MFVKYNRAIQPVQDDVFIEMIYLSGDFKKIQGKDWADEFACTVLGDRVVGYRVIAESVCSEDGKVLRYTDKEGSRDHIDHCAGTFMESEFRGAMKFTIGKYLSRLGKKDSVVREVEKIADYANRWLEYEKNRG